MHATLLKNWRSVRGASELRRKNLSTGTTAIALLGNARAALELSKNWTKALTWKYERFHFHGFVCVAILHHHATELLIVKVRRLKLKPCMSILMMSLSQLNHAAFFIESTHCIFYFLVMKQNHTVVAAQCSCVAGQGEACSQVATLMFIYKIDEEETHAHISTPTTYVLGDWSNGMCLQKEHCILIKLL